MHRSLLIAFATLLALVGAAVGANPAGATVERPLAVGDASGSSAKFLRISPPTA